MNMKDYLKTSFFLLYREKGKKIYTIVILLCCIIIIGILLFNRNIETLLNRGLSNVIGFRTLSVKQRKSIEDDELLKNNIADLLDIEHVVDVYEDDYRETIITETNLANENLDGTVTLLRGTTNTLPTIVEGRNFEEGETGVAICPVSFFPSSDSIRTNRRYIIDGRTLIGKTFTVKYHNYLKNSETGELIEDQTFSKEFKIIGVYDVSERFNDTNTCYISAQDMNEIVNTKSSWEKEQYNSKIKIFHNWEVVIDSIDNVNYVANQIENMGFEISGYVSSIDMNYVNTIRIVIIMVLFVTLLTAIVIVRSYAKKMINSEEKNIAILRISGYSKRRVCSIYALKSLINNSIIYIIGVTIGIITFFVLKYNVSYIAGIDLVGGGINLYIFPFLFAFFVIVIIPTIVIIYNIITKSKSNIVELIGSVE